MVTKKKYKLAFIGGGVESAVGYAHFIASQMDHRWQLVSGCFSRNAEINEETVRAWNLSDIRIYDQWEILLEKEKNKIDAVLILTPTPLHYEMVSAAIKAGIPTICEKALATSFKEAQMISELQKINNGFVAVTHNYTGYPMLRELKAMVESNKLGELLQIQIEMPQEGFIKLDINSCYHEPQKWRLKDGEIPGVSLDLGSHLQHMVHYISGTNPISLVADQNTFGHYQEVIDDVSIIAKYPNGLKSVMWFGKSSLGHRNGLRIRVYGSKGSAEWFQMVPEELIYHDIHGNRMIIDRASNVDISCLSRYQRFKPGHPAGFIEAFANIYVDIAQELDDYLANGAYDSEWTYGAYQASIGLKVLEAAKKSSIYRQWIDLT